jgi:CheY-like chemotaxis protein
MSIPPSDEPKWMRQVLIAMHVGTVLCFATVGAQSGTAALEKVASERPSLVLLDLMD